MVLKSLNSDDVDDNDDGDGDGDGDGDRGDDDDDDDDDDDVGGAKTIWEIGDTNDYDED